ncbi:ribose 5-phosphate isomerase [Rickenella mellea]|uniref:Ribose-5-phosphate isomerase n=1 Tax=Rickenella mellea TaxID=50990 RepID=A0A4Y7PZL8_9AGAM|nr:ribose 5-phosphate isomerase [Rickenella mellea]
MPSPALLNLDREYVLAIHSAFPDFEHNPVNPNVKAVAPVLSTVEAAKRFAAFTAVDRHVLQQHKIIGIGSGSTVPYVVERIVAQGEDLNRDRVFIPTGFQSKELIVKANLRLGDVDQYPTIDVTIDGADEVDHDLNCIKGGGACHLREKVLAEAAETWVIVADYRKNSQVLGTTYKAGVPIEVAPFAYAKLLQNLHRLGSPGAVLRMAQTSKAGPIVTDNGNFVIDAPFDEEWMKEPHDLLTKIKMLTGVVEVGLFCGMAEAAYFGTADGNVTIKWRDGRVEKVDVDKPASKQ